MDDKENKFSNTTSSDFISGDEEKEGRVEAVDDLIDQEMYLAELSSVLQEPVPKEEIVRFTQSQMATRLGIPRSTVPRYIEVYEKITAPLHFVIRTQTNAFITERGLRFFKLVRTLRDQYGFSHDQLLEHIQKTMKNCVMLPTLNSADFEMLKKILRMRDAIDPENKVITELQSENAMLKKSLDELTRQNQAIETKYDCLVKQNEEMKQALEGKLEQVIEKISTMSREQPEKKGLLAKLLGL